MIIVHVNWTFGLGGIETMLVNIANEQVNAGHDIHIVIMEHGLVEHSFLKELHPSIKIHYAHRRYGAMDMIAVLRFNWILERIRPDVIHLHGSTVYKYILDPRLRKICVSTLHDMPHAKNTGCINMIPKVFAISNSVAEELFKYKGVKAIVNFNGIRPELFKVKEQKQHGGIFRIVQVSRLMHEKKGQDILIKAGGELAKMGYSDFSINFIGDGDSLAYLQQLAKDCDIADKVFFLGAKPQLYIFDHLCDYDLFVQPSRFEGFGLTVAEAMAAKVPVLVSSNQGPLEIIDNGKYGCHFEINNVKDCANKMEVFLKHENDINMIELAYQRVVKLYNVKNTTKRYLKEYMSQNR